MTYEFKAQTVRLIRESGKSIGEVAQELDLTESAVRTWVRQAAVYQLLVSYRSGDMWAPRVEETEALQAEARYFLDCVASGTRPFNDGRAGLRVVRILEAADESLRRRTEIVFASPRRPSIERRALRFRPVRAYDYAARTETIENAGT